MKLNDINPNCRSIRALLDMVYYEYDDLNEEKPKSEAPTPTDGGGLLSVPAASIQTSKEADTKEEMFTFSPSKEQHEMMVVDMITEAEDIE